MSEAGDDGGWGLRPLPGGASGETFLSRGPDGTDVVLRIYAGRSAARGPLAPEVDAAVLELVRDLLPVPRVLEVRRGDPAADLPGLLVTELLPGVRLTDLAPHLDDAGLARVGARLGTLTARLGHVVQPATGRFLDRSLVPVPFPPELADLEAFLAHHAPRLRDVLGEETVAALEPVVARAQDLLDEHPRRCLVHGDLNAANLLVDEATLEVTGLLDWEFAHVGSAYSDLGNLLRHEPDDGPFAGAVLDAYTAAMPARALPGPGALREVTRAADLAALVDLAARPDAVEGPGGGDPSAVPSAEPAGSGAAAARARLRLLAAGWTARDEGG